MDRRDNAGPPERQLSELPMIYRALLLSLLAVTTLSMTGCGGCSNNSMSTLRARALANPPEDEPAPSPAPKVATPESVPPPPAIAATPVPAATPAPPPAPVPAVAAPELLPPAEAPSFAVISPALPALDPPPEPEPPANVAETAPAAAPQPAFDPAILLSPRLDTVSKLPIPDDDALTRSRDLLREMYKDDVEAARKPENRGKLVTKLMSEATKVQAHPADYYELLRITRDLAARSGDATNALKAVELTEKRFQVDGTALRLEVLDQLSKLTRTAAQATPLVAKSKEVLLTAMERDDYDAADKAYALLMDFTRIKGDRVEIQRATQSKSALEAARLAYDQVQGALKLLEADPNDAQACETIGKYLCLVKNRWEHGLPLLVRGADVKLRVVASIDMELGRGAQATLELADQYWEMADDYKQPFKRGLHFRACHCYQVSLSQLGGSLDKLRAQKRLDEANAYYGRDEVQKALAPRTATAAVLPAYSE